MGRRSLRKIDPQLDLSRHFFEWSQLAKPIPLSDILPGTGPLELEVGSGKGLFLENASARFPGHRFLGIELAGKYARFAAARLARHGRPNAVVVHGHALDILTEGIPDSSAHALHLYFPDPWWKKRHHKRRMMNPDFLAQVLRVLQGGGRFHFWTDVRDYFELGLEAVAAFPEFSAPAFPPEEPPQHDRDYRTHFERRTRLAGQPVYRAQFTKQSPAC